MFTGTVSLTVEVPDDASRALLVEKMTKLVKELSNFENDSNLHLPQDAFRISQSLDEDFCTYRTASGYFPL